MRMKDALLAVLLAGAVLCSALSDDELFFLRNTERDTVCTNIGLACHGGCPGVTCTDDNEHILEVHWSSDNVGILPETLAGLDRLQVLDLSNNSIDGLAMSFVFPPSLHSLNLSSNKLAALPLQRMDLPNVTALDLSHNTLSALPEMTAPLLERLDISSNFVHTLPDSFRDFKHLTSVGLGDNCLNCAEVAAMLGTHVNYTCNPSAQLKCGIPSSSHPAPKRLPTTVVIAATCGAVGLVLIVLVVVFVVKRVHKRRHIAYTTIEDPVAYNP